MATTNTSSVLSLLLVVVSLVSCFAPSASSPETKVTPSIIQSICAKTVDPDFCTKALQSDRRTALTDIRGLTLISIGLAQKQGIASVSLINSLSQKSPDAELKDKYTRCVGFYDAAIIELQGAKTNLAAGKYVGIEDSASSALENVQSCEDLFEAPPKDPVALADSITNMENLCSVVFNVVKELLS